MLEALAELRRKYKADAIALKRGTNQAPAAPAASAAGTGATWQNLYKGGQFDIGGLLGEIGRSHDEANAKNQDRLKEIMGLYDLAEKDIAGFGESEKRDILRREDQDIGSINADAINRGVYGLTTLDALRTMRKGETERSLTNLAERVGVLKSGLRTQRGSVIERVSDEGPDTGALFGLIGQAESLRAEKAARDEDNKRRDKELEDIRAELKAKKKTGYWSYGSWLPGGRAWVDTSPPE